MYRIAVILEACFHHSGSFRTNCRHNRRFQKIPQCGRSAVHLKLLVQFSTVYQNGPTVLYQFYQLMKLRMSESDANYYTFKWVLPPLLSFALFIAMASSYIVDALDNQLRQASNVIMSPPLALP